MRLIDIYRETADGTVVPVTSGCIQSGEPPELTRTPNNKFYEMSDGTCVCYPCATAKAEMTLELECTREQATAIDLAAHHGSLLFAGMLFGSNTAGSELPFRTGYRAFLTGGIKIAQMYAKSSSYRVALPLRLDVSGETYRTVRVPALYPGHIALGESTEFFEGYDYRLMNIDGSVRPVFVRKNTWFTSSSELFIRLLFARADEPDPILPEDLRPFTASVTGAEVTALSGSITATVPLVQGSSTVDICITKAGLQDLRMRLHIYRQAVIS